MLVCSFVLAGQGALTASAQAAPPSGAPAHAPAQNWSFNGPLGHFDLGAVQRGYAVFAGVCASCHSLTQVHFSDLGDMGLTPEQVAALAASWQVAAGRDAEGHLKHRKATPDDALPRPYADPEAARAANRGAVPPDLSRITQVYPGGPDRVYALLTGYAPVKAPTATAGKATNGGSRSQRSTRSRLCQPLCHWPPHSHATAFAGSCRDVCRWHPAHCAAGSAGCHNLSRVDFQPACG
ncbi:ubiquinol cytochrome C oxidoreductase, cytochrome C1 subunit [Acetobacter malorum]|uniref:Cytochrome c1 n=1 Tax=Acetobacter malorum TaxID=178901 RepID=A0A177G9G2_9PROT|nr:ubiquinol cytochrome C oxidoreductase, cytochrome C1 subunit [Acetobacter malorum]